MIRPELEPLPDRIASLRVDTRGYPVPWFVPWENGVPEFRAMDAVKLQRAIREKLCWVCGGPLGVFLSFAVGPMCAINRTTPEPPSHRQCATWSARNCPFLSRPHMRRREDDTINAATHAELGAGFPILRNPGVIAVWTTKGYGIFRAHAGGPGILIEMGEPESVDWFAEGRRATIGEIETSIAAGLPALYEMVDRDPDPVLARAELERQRLRLLPFLPKA